MVSKLRQLNNTPADLLKGFQSLSSQENGDQARLTVMALPWRGRVTKPQAAKARPATTAMEILRREGSEVRETEEVDSTSFGFETSTEEQSVRTLMCFHRLILEPPSGTPEWPRKARNPQLVRGPQIEPRCDRRVESRKPERYSSAAPLSADGRQRIVSERLDIKDNLVISVSIGPPNYRFLTSKDKSKWEANDVAKSVLSDKSTARLTTGQRVAESSIIDAHCHEIAGEPYWYYEYLAQKSPTAVNDQQLTYRHSVAVTAEREGYLYSLNVSALSKNWNVMQPVLKKTISSLRLLPPTQNYVPPYKDPWRFW